MHQTSLHRCPGRSGQTMKRLVWTGKFSSVVGVDNDDVHCKNSCISTDNLWRVFSYFNGTEPVPYSFVSVNRRNNELQCRPVLHYPVDLPIQTYTEPVRLKYGKLAPKYPWIYEYFYSVTTRSIRAKSSVADSIYRLLIAPSTLRPSPLSLPYSGQSPNDLVIL